MPQPRKPAGTPPARVGATPPDELIDRAVELGLWGEDTGLEALVPDELLELVDRVERLVDTAQHRAAAAAAVAEAPAGLIAALAKAQGEFPGIAKSHTATVKTKTGGDYTYTYADLGDVLAAVRPVLSRNGLAITQPTRTENGKVFLITELLHATGDKLTSEVELGQSTASPQQFGGALTYLRRYELVTLLGIAAEQDLDAQEVDTPARNGHTAPAPAPLPAWAREASTDDKGKLLDALEAIIGRDAGRALVMACKQSLGGSVPWVLIPFARGIAANYAALEDAQALALREAARERAEGAAAKAVAAAQDAAAERPDEEPPDDVGDNTAPPAGSLDVPDLPSNPAQATAILRGAGCTCEDPLALKGETPTKNDTCPMVGHGIPF